MKITMTNAFIASAEDVEAMVSALEKMPGANVKKSLSGYVLKTKGGTEVFRAMVGSGGSYLVRHAEGLFL